MSGVPLSVATIPSGSDYGLDGTVELPGSSQVYWWQATVTGAVTPLNSPLTVYNGPLTKQIEAIGGTAGFTNATLAGLGLPGDAAGVAVSGQGAPSIGGASVSDTMAFRFFNETLPAGASFVLWESGVGQAGATASFSIGAAGSADQPLVTADWTYAPLAPFDLPGEATVTASGSVLDITAAATSAVNPDAVVVVTPNVPLTSLTVQGTAGVADTWGIALIGAAAQNNAPCFLAGTIILTRSGPVAVERLRAGDRVVARHAGVVPIAWLGRRRLVPGRHVRPEAVWPFRILRDAVAPGVPARDLLLSPDHAVCLGGVLIPVKYLANGLTIFQDRGFAEVEYWHVELPCHDVLLAEALPVESYLDTGNRGAFENGGVAPALHPEFGRRRWEQDACAPLWGEGGPVDHVRALLRARARERQRSSACRAA